MALADLSRDELAELVDGLWLYEAEFTDFESKFIDDLSRDLSEGMDPSEGTLEILWKICQKVGLDV